MNCDWRQHRLFFPQARHTFSPWQAVGILIFLLLLAYSLFWNWRLTLFILNAAATLFYLFATLHRIAAIRSAFCENAEITVSPQEISERESRPWPRYLVLLPLYKEAAILPHLIHAMQQLDYPADRLEIRLLIEEDDTETLSAAHSACLPPQFKIFPIPVSLPRTKPKACDAALFADADNAFDYLVIYDAEDRPAPDQLKKAVCAFERLPRQTACLQAHLDYYNTSRNFLTKCFTLEYATWFGLCLPGLASLRAPLPLGGTSNHFRYPILRQCGGWDEYNVTEDCDLGLRLATHGFDTAVLASVTEEQACASLLPWLRQRSRWIKGYLQTYLVNLRSPLRLLRSLGWSKFLHFHLLLGGTVLSLLINPIYWLMTVLWFILRPTCLQPFFPLPIFLVSGFSLFFGNFAFLYGTTIAAARTHKPTLAKCSLAMPLYWALMSIGAWKGILQLLWAPHHWEKTPHPAEQNF